MGLSWRNDLPKIVNDPIFIFRHGGVKMGGQANTFSFILIKIRDYFNTSFISVRIKLSQMKNSINILAPHSM